MITFNYPFSRLATLAITVLSIAGCGGSAAPSFSGTWSGAFTKLDNTCPFPVAKDINPLFPMTVSVDDNDVYTVVAVTGETAIGGQGVGESISFLAKSSHFGNYGSIAPYTCASISSEIGFLSTGDNSATASLVVKFTDCTKPDSPTKKTSCGATYFGEATRTQQ
jgi:hypothetical protein